MAQSDNNDEETEELAICHFCNKCIQPDDEDQSEVLIAGDFPVPICGECNLGMGERDRDDAEYAWQEDRRRR